MNAESEETPRVPHKHERLATDGIKTSLLSGEGGNTGCTIKAPLSEVANNLFDSEML